MSKIATYPSADTPLQLSDRLIGTEAPRLIPSPTPLATKNFSLGELLQLFSSNFPAASLQAVLNTGNTATQNITLTGTITTTLIKPNNIEDTSGSQGTTFQYLSKGTSSINWVDLPVDSLQAVLNKENTATQNITLVGNITTTKIIPGNIQDDTAGIGTTGQVLSKTATGIRWVNNSIVYTPGLADVLSVGNTATNNINLIGDVTATRFIKSGGTSSQYLMADGSVTTGSGAITLNQVLTNGNTSLLDAKIGELYLYDTTELEYGKIKIYDSEFRFYNNLGNQVSSLSREGVTFSLLSGYTAQLLATTITANRQYQLPNVSGTIALISDIPTITPAALTRTNDTNVTLSLGGSPSTALLAATSLTLGWTGTLADSRIASASTWNAKQNTITLTTTGSSGASTFISNTLNVPTYTLSGLGGQPLATNLTSLAGLVYVGTSFVKMTASGTFALDTNTYLTSVGTGTANELTYWSGVNTLGSLTTATYPSLTELTYVKGVTSSIQTQLGTKVDKNTTITGATKTKITYDSKGLVTTGADATTADIADSTNKRYQTDNQNSFNDATSSIQTQLDAKALNNAVVHLAGYETITGEKTFSISPLISELTGNQILGIGTDKKIFSLSTTNYPSLAELTYVKGVTSSIQTQLNAKQSNLVSGTNIKSINGFSLLGSGNLPVMGIHATMTPYSGLTVCASINGAGVSGGLVGVAGRVTVNPFVPAQTITCSSLYINVTVSGVGALAQIVIYSDTNGKPDTRLYQSADLDCSTTGKKTVTTTQTFNAGNTYWIGVQTSSTQTITGIVATGLIPAYIQTVSAGSGYITSATYGSPPNPFGAVSNTIGAVAFIGITI